jgi:hypothetical protein
MANVQKSRRALLRASATALGTSAFSYGRILGANDRILLGHVGVGNRGRELASIAAGLKDSHNVEMAAVCDLWKVNRERAQSEASREYGRTPRAFAYVEDVLALALVQTPAKLAIINRCQRSYQLRGSSAVGTLTGKSSCCACVGI